MTPARVLIVEDDANTRLLVTTLLRHAGHDTVEAADGVEGLARAREARPDLIIFDLSMPGMSGMEFVRALRADPDLRDINLALYTATPMNPALRDFMEIYRVADAIPKPSEPEEFLQTVAVALARAK